MVFQLMTITGCDIDICAIALQENGSNLERALEFLLQQKQDQERAERELQKARALEEQRRLEAVRKEEERKQEEERRNAAIRGLYAGQTYTLQFKNGGEAKLPKEVLSMFGTIKDVIEEFSAEHSTGFLDSVSMEQTEIVIAFCKLYYERKSLPHYFPDPNVLKNFVAEISKKYGTVGLLDVLYHSNYFQVFLDLLFRRFSPECLFHFLTFF